MSITEGKPLFVSHPSRRLEGGFPLPASKSEANRALIIQAFSKGRIQLHNLSDAQDTVTLASLLASDAESLDVGDAGTCMRFLTAYLAIQPRDVILTGSARMQERPIGPLVDALRTIGAEIHYLAKEGYPPLYLFGRNAKFRSSTVSIPGNVSSQYISALLMLAPTLPQGLAIQITGEVLSRSYIEMTLSLMAQFGVSHEWKGQEIHVPKQHYASGEFHVESDWSAASYAFALAGLAEESSLTLTGLKETSLQGDRSIVDWMSELGVQAVFENEVWKLSRTAVEADQPVELDLINAPDLAQTLVPYCAARGIEARFTGLATLRIKETDRILALQQELAQFGVSFNEVDPGWFALEGDFQPKKGIIRTYGDHRMAMGFAPLALVTPGLEVEHPAVVGKSFPGFWESMAGLGFVME